MKVKTIILLYKGLQKFINKVSMIQLFCVSKVVNYLSTWQRVKVLFKVDIGKQVICGPFNTVHENMVIQFREMTFCVSVVTFLNFCAGNPTVFIVG